MKTRSWILLLSALALVLGLIVLVLIIEWISAKIRVKLARG